MSVVLGYSVTGDSVPHAFLLSSVLTYTVLLYGA